ncbi:MAG TPA: sialate O-acetylesterase [Terriglobales bacterium]|nr:sialate O-acetylesterase [Terriglobales bacterium]
MTVCSLLFGLLVPVCWADPMLPHLFSDHMVLQQQRPIHVWGKADPEEKITVTLSSETETAEANSSGTWSIELPAMSAGGPFTLKISGKSNVVFKDVMIGEVWIASGQSNMTFSLYGADNGPEEVRKADYPDLRLFMVAKRPSPSPQEDTLPASWEICTPDSAKEFSAVAYYFARELHRKVNVPVGIIETAWPGTTIEMWMPPSALQPVQAKFGISPSSPVSSGDREPFNLEFDDFELLRDGEGSLQKTFSNFDDATSRDSFGGYWSYNWSDAPATSFNLVSPGRGENGHAIRVSGGLDASDDSRLTARLHADNSPADLTSYTGLQFWVRGNGSFRVQTFQPTITDWDNYSSKSFQGTSDWRPVVVKFNDLRQDGWGVVKELTLNSISDFVIECMPASGFPPVRDSDLYNGMIAPILPYNFRGAIWYQGESNALSAYEYRQLLPALINNWRGSTKSIFPFLIVQLPNHGAIPQEPGDSAWAELREAEFMTARNVPNTGLAVTIDVGDPNDLHPHRKLEVGERLGLWALGTTYKQNIVYSGPLYQSSGVEGNKVILQFANIGSGLVAKGDSLRGFAIAGADHKFYWANATIQGSTVAVSSEQVPHPVAVRYAWGDSPICNLFNEEGLPASPFRTDDWPGITISGMVRQ